MLPAPTVYHRTITILTYGRADTEDRDDLEAARTVNERLSKIQAYIKWQVAILLEQRETLRFLQEFASQLTPLPGSGGDNSSTEIHDVYIYIVEIEFISNVLLIKLFV